MTIYVVLDAWCGFVLAFADKASAEQWIRAETPPGSTSGQADYSIVETTVV